jgi:transcription antitermination factor NusG
MQSSATIKKWFALYTRPRAEKQLFRQLQKAGFNAYLPLRKVLKYWSDRKKWVEEPLFSSYIFVFISEAEYYDVLNIPGAVRYVTFEGKAVPIPPQQIEAIKQFISSGEELPEVELKRSPGDKVDIIAGPMKGIEGELVDIMGRKKVRVEINGLGRAVYLELPASHIR